MSGIMKQDYPFHGTTYRFILGLFILAALTAACTGNTAKASPQAQSPNATGAPLQVTRAAPTPTFASITWAQTLTCSNPGACPRLVVAQNGQVSRLDWSARGLQAAAPSLLPKGLSQNGRFVIDSGMPSPDGKWAAFTSISSESGGPVYLQNLQTGAYTDLIQSANAHLAASQPKLQEDALWDVIGWFPDSQQVMIGASDLSSVVIVAIDSFAARTIPFPGDGNGGRLYVNLARDGSCFYFIGQDESGGPVINRFDLVMGRIRGIERLPNGQGAIFNPQSSPDGKYLAYLVQKGQPSTGMTYAINLLPLDNGASKTLVDSASMTVLAWSPDSRYIAFTRDASGQAILAGPGTTPPPMRGNIWVVATTDGTLTQVTAVDGLARNPAWAKDSRTLAFVTHDGQVGLASLDQPGKIWQIAPASGQQPERTDVFFLP